MIVVATKLDATTNREHLDELRAFGAKRGLEFHAISSATGEGIVELVRAMADALDRIPKPLCRLIRRTRRKSALGHDGRSRMHATRRSVDVARAHMHRPDVQSTRGAIGLFGGTFDPIHAGHIAVAQAAQRRFHLDAIYFVLSSRPPHKTKPALTPFAHRFAMVALACSDHQGFLPSLAEAPMDGATPRLLHHRHGAAISPRTSGRSHLFYCRRRPVSRNSDLEKLRNAARFVRFYRREPAWVSIGRAAAGDSAGQTWPHAFAQTRIASCCRNRRSI